ncbi:hypothetical protein AM593_00921, partial [Mytilus galloprovincialis]
MENLETALNLLQNNCKRMEQAMNQQIEKVIEIIANDIDKEDVIKIFLDYNVKHITKIRNKRLKDAVQFMTNCSKTTRNALMQQTSAIKKLSDAYQRTKTPKMVKHELDSHVSQWLEINGRRARITETPLTVTTNLNVLEDDKHDMSIAAPTPCLNGTRQVIHCNTVSQKIDKPDYLTMDDRNNNNNIHSNNQRRLASSNRSHFGHMLPRRYITFRAKVAQSKHKSINRPIEQSIRRWDDNKLKVAGQTTRTSSKPGLNSLVTCREQGNDDGIE